MKQKMQEEDIGEDVKKFENTNKLGQEDINEKILIWLIYNT